MYMYISHSCTCHITHVMHGNSLEPIQIHLSLCYTNNFMHSTHFSKITWSIIPLFVPLQPPYHTSYELQDTVINHNYSNCI